MHGVIAKAQIASAMVKRAKRIKCQFGGDHSIADCCCDPHQLGDAVSTMQDEWDRASDSSVRGKRSARGRKDFMEEQMEARIDEVEF